MRYLVIQSEFDGSIQFGRSFTDGRLAVECANDRLTRANINGVFVIDDIKFIDSCGSLAARNNEGTIKVTILKEDE